MYHERTKNIDIKYHFIQETISKGIVFVKKIYTRDNLAGMFMKPFPIVKFKFCLNIIGMYKK